VSSCVPPSALNVSLDPQARTLIGILTPACSPADVAEDVTSHAIKSGYRHVDCAHVYRNEEPTAKGMLGAGVPREQLFYTSKVPPKCINYEDAKRSINESLEKTKLKYIDLYLLHAPYHGTEGRLGAWRALVEAVKEDKVRSIGVSNFGVHHLDELEQWQKVSLARLFEASMTSLPLIHADLSQQQSPSDAGILSVNQVELHPWLARPDIVDWCVKRDIVLEAYSPLVRATRGDDPLLKPLAAKHNKTPAQILLRWGLQKGFVVLPKSVTHSRIEENTKVYDFELSAEDMKSLDTGKYEPCTWDPTTAELDS
jgi:diketogulonate reductase-like aldo/keto reductase